MNRYCALVRDTLAYYLEFEQAPPPAEPFGRKAGCFVSLHTSQGELRGCIGTISAVHEDLSDEISQNAVSAAMRDPRFPPVERDELANLAIEVSVMGPTEAVGDQSELDAQRYGVVVESGYRRGVLLPDLPGVDSVAQQVDIACRKAGIYDRDNLQISRFEVEKYGEFDN